MSEYSSVCVLIPTLNEASTIGSVIDGFTDEGFESILVIDGGSDDGTRSIAEERGAGWSNRRARVRVLRSWRRSV